MMTANEIEDAIIAEQVAIDTANKEAWALAISQC
jgi:hypothetical protein|tara:strand:- start:630 stop:731 length:102 start_codon:yes stop_codon:yes gene_type:complete